MGCKRRRAGSSDACCWVCYLMCTLLACYLHFYTEVHLSFCNYMNENVDSFESAGEWTTWTFLNIDLTRVRSMFDVVTYLTQMIPFPRSLHTVAFRALPKWFPSLVLSTYHGCPCPPVLTWLTDMIVPSLVLSTYHGFPCPLVLTRLTEMIFPSRTHSPLSLPICLDNFSRPFPLLPTFNHLNRSLMCGKLSRRGRPLRRTFHV